MVHILRMFTIRRKEAKMGEEKKEEGKEKASLLPGLILIILGLAFLALQFVERLGAGVHLRPGGTHLRG